MTIRYRSTAGLVVFGLWCVVIASAAVWFAVAGSLVPAVGAGVLVLLALWLTSLQLTLTTDGELCFVGVLRRQHWPASDLRTVRPGTNCMVFRFAGGGGAMVAGRGSGNDWDTLLHRLVELNPSALVGLPRDGP